MGNGLLHQIPVNREGNATTILDPSNELTISLFETMLQKDKTATTKGKAVVDVVANDNTINLQEQKTPNALEIGYNINNSKSATMNVNGEIATSSESSDIIEVKDAPVKGLATPSQSTTDDDTSIVK